MATSHYPLDRGLSRNSYLTYMLYERMADLSGQKSLRMRKGIDNRSNQSAGRCSSDGKWDPDLRSLGIP